MPTYVFHLHDGSAVTPVDEVVTAEGPDEARDLAELRLLLGGRFTSVEVYHEGELQIRLKRDGPSSPGVEKTAVE